MTCEPTYDMSDIPEPKNICTVCGGRGFTEDGGSAIGRAFILGYQKAKEGRKSEADLKARAHAIMERWLTKCPEEPAPTIVGLCSDILRLIAEGEKA